MSNPGSGPLARGERAKRKLNLAGADDDAAGRRGAAGAGGPAVLTRDVESTGMT